MWHYHRRQDPLRPVDAIVGLGSYDLRVADHCAALYRQAIAPLVIFTGGAGNWTAGVWDTPEATLFARRALTLGVAQPHLLTETRSTNLSENFRFTRALAEKRGLGLRSAAVVSKPNTLRRAYATAAQVWPELEVLATAADRHWSEQTGPGIDREAVINEMVGDLQRLLVYPQRGWQIPQTVPAPVLAAYRELIRRGYRRHLLP